MIKKSRWLLRPAHIMSNTNNVFLEYVACSEICLWIIWKLWYVFLYHISNCNFNSLCRFFLSIMEVWFFFFNVGEFPSLTFASCLLWFESRVLTWCSCSWILILLIRLVELELVWDKVTIIRIGFFYIDSLVELQPIFFFFFTFDTLC